MHEVVETGKLKELNWASGGAWGGTRVDAAFEEFLMKVFGKKNLVTKLEDTAMSRMNFNCWNTFLAVDMTFCKQSLPSAFI